MSNSARCTTYKPKTISCLLESVQKLPGQMDCDQFKRPNFAVKSEATPGAACFFHNPDPNSFTAHSTESSRQNVTSSRQVVAVGPHDATPPPHTHTRNRGTRIESSLVKLLELAAFQCAAPPGPGAYIKQKNYTQLHSHTERATDSETRSKMKDICYPQNFRTPTPMRAELNFSRKITAKFGLLN
jgi:hypothetical protein